MIQPSRSSWKSRTNFTILGAVALTFFAFGGFRNLQANEPTRPKYGCRGDLHIYMINGLTILPHVYGSMHGVAAHVEASGFQKARVASHYWRWSFVRDIRRIHCENPNAKFALVGYSIGGSVVTSMARDLEADGIFVDLMVYIDAHSFVHDLSCRPANVGRIVTINSCSPLLPGKCRPGQDCFQVGTRSHLHMPRQEQTLAILVDALRAVGTAPAVSDAAATKTANSAVGE